MTVSRSSKGVSGATVTPSLRIQALTICAALPALSAFTTALYLSVPSALSQWYLADDCSFSASYATLHAASASSFAFLSSSSNAATFALAFSLAASASNLAAVARVTRSWKPSS